MTDFSKTRALFHLAEDTIYLDGNSLGPLPAHATDRVASMMQDQWGEMLITGWNKAGWMEHSTRIGDRIARLIGAPASSVIVGDTLSIRVYQALAAALALNPDRRVILSDSGNFPSDLYIAQGLIQSLGKGHELRVVPPEAIADAITDEVAVLMLTEVDFQTGRLHDMASLTAKAHAAGALTVWDLAHSAGAVPVDLTAAKADFATGCTYKFLNGGPGAPAFLYIRPDLQDQSRPAISGWLGHAAPFEFSPDYTPAPGITRMRVGTPPVIAMAALDAALDVWDEVDMTDLRAQSQTLSELLITEVETRCPTLHLASPRDPDQRGSQVSFRHAQGYAIMQALIARGVIGDFRAPDIIRFGITPLYTTKAEITRAAEILQEIMDNALWDRPEYKTRAAVT